MKKTLLIVNALVITMTATAQTAKSYIDVGNIKALMDVNGYLWMNDSLGQASCEFPKGSGKHIGHLSGLWIGGFQDTNIVSVGVLLGRDFRPGAISNKTAITQAESGRWSKIWKVNRGEITNFLANGSHTIANTPPSILDWPGRGNTYATDSDGAVLFSPLTNYNQDYAPFVDVNGNGIYDPLSGDYPDIIGDQALWGSFTDWHSHSVPGAIYNRPIGLEIHCLAYAYSRSSLIDNVIYYKYDIVNKSDTTLDSMAVGFFADLDLGMAIDDYMGYDSARNLMILYNASNTDGASTNGNSYGTTIPLAGLSIIDFTGATCNNLKSANYFMPVSFGTPTPWWDTTQNTSVVKGQPKDAYYRLTGRYSNGQRLRNDYQGAGIPSNGLGAGQEAKYIFNGDPQYSTQWSECQSGNAPGDRRAIISVQANNSLQPGNKFIFSIALVASNPSLQNGCPTLSFTPIQQVADTARQVYCNPLPISTGIKGQNNSASHLQLFPNPVSDRLNLVTQIQGDYTLTIYSATGSILQQYKSKQQRSISLDVADLPAGFYNVNVKSKDTNYTAKFIKN